MNKKRRAFTRKDFIKNAVIIYYSRKGEKIGNSGKKVRSVVSKIENNH